MTTSKQYPVKEAIQNIKLQKSVQKEVLHITIGTVACAAVQVAIFALLGRLDRTVWLGTAVGSAFAVLNFILLGLTMQKAAGNAEKAKQIAQFSYSVRMLLTCVVAILGFQLAALNGIATAVSLFFPRITILVMQMLGFYKPQPKEASAA